MTDTILKLSNSFNLIYIAVQIDNAIEEKIEMIAHENHDDDFVNPPPKSIIVKGRKQSRKRREQAEHTEKIESRPKKRVKKTQKEDEGQKKAFNTIEAAGDQNIRKEEDNEVINGEESARNLLQLQHSFEVPKKPQEEEEGQKNNLNTIEAASNQKTREVEEEKEVTNEEESARKNLQLQHSFEIPKKSQEEKEGQKNDLNTIEAATHQNTREEEEEKEVINEEESARKNLQLQHSFEVPKKAQEEEEGQKKDLADEIVNQVVTDIHQLNIEDQRRYSSSQFKEWEELMEENSRYCDEEYCDEENTKKNTIEYWQDAALLKQEMAGSAIDSCKRKQDFINKLFYEKDDLMKKNKCLKKKLKRKEEEIEEVRAECRKLMLHNRELESTLEAMKHKEKEETGEVTTATAPKTRSAIKRIKNRTDRKENSMPDFEVIKPKKGARKKRDEVVDLTQLPEEKEEKPKANEDKKGIKLAWNKHEVFNLMDKKYQDIIKDYWTRKEKS
jgi:hypothetical protein